MTAILRAALLAALAVSSISTFAAGQGSSSDSLGRRIDYLERQVAGLEQRVRELEALVKVESPRDRPVSATANWRDLANWRQLRRGMKADQVRALLGEPESVRVAIELTFWQYPDGANVGFTSGKVDGWSEPRR